MGESPQTLPAAVERVPEHVKALLEASLDAAVVLDGERRILYYNRAYQLASGARGRQLAVAAEAGRHCYEVFPLDVCETAWARIFVRRPAPKRSASRRGYRCEVTANPRTESPRKARRL